MRAYVRFAELFALLGSLLPKPRRGPLYPGLYPRYLKLAARSFFKTFQKFGKNEPLKISCKRSSPTVDTFDVKSMFAKKIKIQTVIREKLHKALSYEKFALKC